MGLGPASAVEADGDEGGRLSAVGDRLSGPAHSTSRSRLAARSGKLYVGGERSPSSPTGIDRPAGEVEQNGCRYELIPNTGRYYLIPVLPYPIRQAGDAKALDIADLQGLDEVRTTFDAHYPAWYEGNAWVTRAGDSLFVMNSHENKDIAQTYAIPLDGTGNITRLSVAIPHWYLIAKRLDAGNGLWLQANANHKGPYTDGRTTRLTLDCRRRPKVTVEPVAALARETWSRGRLELSLSHVDGAVEVGVGRVGVQKAPGHGAAGWKRSDRPRETNRPPNRGSPFQLGVARHEICGRQQPLENPGDRPPLCPAGTLRRRNPEVRDRA